MRVRHKWLATGAVIALATVLWPGQPGASADTTLGGYEGSAIASVLKVEISDPNIPIPATPQLEGSVAYSSSKVETGPTTRALASYLWPGAVLGDGFDQLVKQPGATYPVQVNSRFPATNDSPAHNTIQLTDGNGMTTSTDGFNTKSSVTMLGLAGNGTNITGGVGTGLNKLRPKSAAKPPTTAPVSLPVSPALAALITAQNITSTSTTTVVDKTITTLAHAAASNIGLLGGLIKIEGFDVKSQVVSDGTKSSVSGGATIGAMTVLGLRLPVDDSGINLGLPALSQTVSSVLKALGISFATVPVTKSVDGASGEFHSQVLEISVDTKPLKSIINNVLNPLFVKFPASARTQLQPLLDLGPSLVLRLGTADATASASPAFDGGSTGDGGTTTGGTAGTPGTPGTPAIPGTGALPGVGGLIPPATDSTTGVNPTSSALSLPPLGAIPRALIVAALVLAALAGWFFRRAAAVILGGTRNCDYGLATGVPDLRRG